MEPDSCHCTRCTHDPGWESRVSGGLVCSLGFTFLAVMCNTSFLVWASVAFATLSFVVCVSDLSAKWDHEARRCYQQRRELWVWFEENYGEAWLELEVATLPITEEPHDAYYDTRGYN